MQPDPIRLPLAALLTGLMLVACGGIPPQEAGLETAEPLGTQASALCAGTSVTSLTVSGISSYCGEISGSGGWAVAWPANAVRLEYSLNGALSASEERLPNPGTSSGSWYFSKSGVAAGSYTFTVRAYPMVIDSAGNRTTCWDSPGSSVSRPVTPSNSSPSTSLSCSRTSSSHITCTGTGGGGAGSLTPLWRTSHQDYYSGAHSYGSWSQGTWTQSFYCEQTTSSTADTLWIEHKVSDSCSMESSVTASAAFRCGPANCAYDDCDYVNGLSCTKASVRQCVFMGNSCRALTCNCYNGRWLCP